MMRPYHPRPPALWAVALALGMASATPVLADTGEKPLTREPSPRRSEAPVAIETTADEAHQIGMMLRCPVCQGQPIAESPSQMAQDMMVRVREMVAEGKSRQAIIDHFVARYGEWVLLDPKAEGMNLALWLLPAVALLLGSIVVWRVVHAQRHNESTPTNRAQARAPRAADEYVDAIRREVDR